MATGTATKALFYPRALLSKGQLVQLTLGTLGPLPDLDLDVVAFDAETGGSADRELAIGLLPDMDEVVVDAAELQFQARSFVQEIDGYSVTNGPAGADAGIVLALDTPAALQKVVIDTPAQVMRPTAGGHTLVVRSAEPGPGGFSFGPPIFAAPPFALPSPMYDPILGGMSVSAVAGNRTQLTFPGTTGSAWLIQLALGDEATKLSPVAFAPAVHSVTIDAAARDLTLVVPGSGGADDTLLWSNANALTPASGTQVATFTPVAQKQLSAALRAAGPGDVTLPIALRFSASARGRIGITGRTLQAHYRVHPLAATPAQAALRGGWTPLALSIPAARRPARGALQLTARHLGRALNDASPVPPPALPSSGVRVDGGRTIAVPAAFAPRASQAAGDALGLVSVSVPLRALGDAEVGLELRADAGGGPGAILAPAVVRRLVAGVATWVAFDLDAELALATGGAPLWVSLRMTQGALHWFGDHAGEGVGSARLSADGGQTWGDVDPLLAPPATPLVQLFHAEPPSAPELALRIGDELLPPLTLTGPVPEDPTEFRLAATALGAPLLDALGAAPGSGRVARELLVFARAVIDVTIAGLTLDYDPPGGA